MEETEQRHAGDAPRTGGRYRRVAGPVSRVRAQHFNLGVVTKRLEILYQILALVVDHLRAKPNSDRRAAVAGLGSQVYDKIQELLESACALGVGAEVRIL
jgi:hypothetical protein